MQSRLPIPKDLERHNNSRHNTTVKYCCPYDTCDNSVESTMRLEWRGIRRKDGWRKHLKAKHNASDYLIGSFQKKGIPTAVLKENVWVHVQPKNPLTAKVEQPESSSSVIGNGVDLDS